MSEVTVPYNFEPRDYQIGVFAARDKGFKRFVEVWHRRAGKDKTGINFMAREMLRRPGIYYYFFPTYSQGRKIMWEGMDKDGFKFLDHIPKELRKRTLHQDMMIELKEEYGGSVFRVVGVDKIDRVVGTNPVGIVYSEYSLMNPMAWNLFRPILAENDGWAYFDFTPRGRNHAYKLYEMARKNPHWHCTKFTIEDTGVLSKSDMDREREEGTPEEIIQQEYYCSFAAGMSGAIYAPYVEKARQQGRISHYPHDDSMPVSTFWDIGWDDDTAILFRQRRGKAKYFIRAHHDRQKSIEDYVKMLKATGYYFDTHWLPHDAAKTTVQTGRTTKEMFEDSLREFGVTGVVEVVPRHSVQDGIAATRSNFSQYHFDGEGCGDVEDEDADIDLKSQVDGFLPALMNYHTKWNPELNRFGGPVHDWSSHYCDALRMEAMSDDIDTENDMMEVGGAPRVITDFNPLGGY